MKVALPAPLENSSTPSEWQADSWESARTRKFTLGLDATPADRLAWLEQAIVLAWATGALPRPRP
jgi:hypothetical protein